MLRNWLAKILRGDELSLEVEPDGSGDFGPCVCCGTNSRTVWGFVHALDACVASYHVHWTLGRVPDHGAHFDLIVGRWGEGATANERSLIALEFRVQDGQPSFMVIDADSRPAADSELVGHVLRRADVIGQPLAKLAFAIVDAIWLQDARIVELNPDCPPPHEC